MADTWMDLWTGIWDNVWGVMYAPIDSEDSEYFNTQIEIYDDSDPSVLLEVLHARMEPTCLTELRAHGAGSFKVSKSDSKILENPSLIAYRKYVKIRLNGSVVGGFIIQTKKTVIVGAGEEADEMWEISGEGPRSSSRDAAVYPPLGLQATSADTRYFNFSTEQGSWYKPEDWSNASVIANWNSAGNWWATAPAQWPDAPTAKWIWDRTGPYAMPQGYVYLRREFTVPTAASHSLFVAVDDSAEIYVDGELLLTTSEHAWQETSRIDMELTAGSHVIGIKAYNYMNTAPGAVLAAMFKFGDPLVPTSAQLLFVSDNLWKVQGYPSVEPGWTIGDVLLTLLDEAKTRGVRFANNWNPSFTASLDSSGASWGDPIPFSFTVGATYEDVISAIEEMGCDIFVDPDTLQVHAWKKRGTDKSIGSTTTAFTEQRRNLVASPRPLAFSGSGWSASSGLATLVSSGWIGGTQNVVANPHIFTGFAKRSYAAGELVTMTVKYRVDATAGAATHITVMPHTRTSDTYYRGGYQVTNPIVLGKEETVVIKWITQASIATDELDIAIVGSDSDSNLLSANSGFQIRATEALIEDGWTDGTFFDGDTTSAQESDKYRWLGLQQASISVYEARKNANAIIFSPGHNLLSAEETGQAEIANTLMLHSKEGWKEATYSDPKSVQRYGRVETQMTTQLSANSADPLIQELFRTKALPEKSATFQIIPVDDMIPFLNFNVGDIVSAPGEVPGVMESRRVMSISFSENGETGKPEFSLEFDTIFKDRQSELEKWMSRISNSTAIGGGFSNSGTLPPTSQTGNPPNALGNVPDAPTGLIVSSIGKFGTDGSASSDFSLTWNPVITGNGFGTLTIREYEVWGRLSTETEFSLLAVVFDSFAYMSGFRPGDTWVFKVRAVSTTGGPGAFSTDESLTASQPVISLGQPSTPTLTSSMGSVTIRWDGLIEGDPAPNYVRYVRVERTSTGSTGTWEERRRNVFANPYAKTALTRFSTTGGASTALSLRTDMTGPTTTAVRSTRNATGNHRLVDFLVGTEMLAATSYRARIRVRSSHALTGVQVLYRPDVASATGSVTADVMDIPIGVSYIDVVAVTHINAPSSTAGVTFIHNGTDVGATLDVTDILIEKMPSDGTMIAGDITSSDPTKRYRWIGATDNSVSVMEELDPWVSVGTVVRGSTVDASSQAGKTYDYRLVAIDIYGGESTPSDEATITVEGVQSGDITGGLASQNLIANGSFESDFASWIIRTIYPNGGSSATVVTGGLAGAKYLRLTRGVEIPGAETELSVAQDPDSFIPVSSVGAYGYFISAKVAASANVVDGYSMRAYWYQGDKVTPASTSVTTVVDEQDVSTTAQYFVGQVFPPADARFMQVAVISTKQDTILYVDDVVAREVISAGMIGQGAITAPHLSAGSVTANALQAGSVTADALAAGSIVADKIGAGQIQTNHLSSDVGASLDISSNASVNILINRTDTIEGDLASTQGAITDLQTYYSFTSEGALIGKTDSSFKLFLKNDRIEILENNTVVSYWDSGQMVVKRFVGEEVVLANHKIEKYNSGTIVKKL